MDWHHLPSLNALRAFLAFHEAGSMSAAGALLNVSHAAISQQIKALETHMGITLLDRRPRRTFLTPEGTQLAYSLERGFEEIGRTVAQLIGTEQNRPVTISVTPSFASGWLMPRLADFRKKNPDIDLMIDPSVEVKSLDAGGIDVALRYGNGNWTGLQAELLVESPLVVVASPKLVPESAKLSDLKDYPWLREPGAHESSPLLADPVLSVESCKGVTELPGNLMLEAARTGQGVAIAARNLVETDIQAGRLRVLYQDPAKKGYYMVTRPGVQRPSLRSFAQWLRRQVAQPIAAQ